MAETTECPVCFEEYVDPKLLSCTHTLCLKCLESLQKSDKKGRHIRCPLCNTKHTVPDRGVKAFVENQTMIQLIEEKQKNQSMAKLLKSEKKSTAPCCESKPTSEESHNVRLRTTKLDVRSNVQEQQTLSVRPKVKSQESSSAEPNLVSLSQKKLAVLQCQYDPKYCGHCGKSDSVLELKKCTKCKTAKYCSRKCQTQDWNSQHKAHCKEIIRLQALVTEKGSVAHLRSLITDSLEAVPLGNPWKVKCVSYERMFVFEDKQILFGTHEHDLNTTTGEIEIYNTTTGIKEGVLYNSQPGEHVIGLCSFEIDKSRYIAVSSEMLRPSDMMLPSDSLRIWPYPFQSPKPICKFMNKRGSYGALNYYEGILFVYEQILTQSGKIKGYDARLETMESPVHVIPITRNHRIIAFCVTKNSGLNVVIVSVMSYSEENLVGSIACLDFKGQELWQLRDLVLNGLLINPEIIFTDHNGHIFACEMQARRRRIIQVNEDLSLHTLVSTPDDIAVYAWNDDTQELCIATRNEQKTTVTSRRYSVRKRAALEERPDVKLQTEPKNDPQERCRVKEQKTPNIKPDVEVQETPSVRPKVKGKETPSARPRDKGQENLSVRPKPLGKVISDDKTNLLTFSRQKLALLLCEYDPKCCQNCRKLTSIDGLEQCFQCKTAKYCSQKCQKEDWKQKHRVHCKEIIRLQSVINEMENAASIREMSPADALEATLQGKPWKLRENDYRAMCTFEDKIVIYGVRYGYANHTMAYFEVYNTSTGTIEDSIEVNAQVVELIDGLCSCKLGESRFTVGTFSCVGVSESTDHLRFWSFPFKSSQPDFDDIAPSNTFGPVKYHDGTLYCLYRNSKCIVAFDATSKKTETKIPTGLEEHETTQDFSMVCGLMRIIIAFYEEVKCHFGIKCLDFKGRELKRLVGVQLNGSTIQFAQLCSVRNGHIFASDPNNHRFIILNADLIVQTFISIPGQIACMAGNDDTNELLVAYYTDKDCIKPATMICKYTVKAGGQK